MIYHLYEIYVSFIKFTCRNYRPHISVMLPWPYRKPLTKTILYFVSVALHCLHDVSKTQTLMFFTSPATSQRGELVFFHRAWFVVKNNASNISLENLQLKNKGMISFFCSPHIIHASGACSPHSLRVLKETKKPNLSPQRTEKTRP